MQILTMAGFVLALALPAEAERQNVPPKDDTEVMCVPNRSPQRTRRDGSPRPTIQCNLVRADRPKRDRPLLEVEGMPANAMVSYERTSGAP
jgi:hypothetical protein